jgi:integrase
MAINLKEYTETIEPGLKSNKHFTKFYCRIKVDGKTKKLILDYTTKAWDKRTRISEARGELSKLREKLLDTSVNFDDTITLNGLSKLYFKFKYDDNSEWKKELESVYKNYCEDGIGKKKIRDIRKIHIDQLVKSMEIKGKSKQTKNGCSPRTIKKVTTQIIRPMLEYAMENKVLEDIPTIKPPKANKQKKKVSEAREKLVVLYTTILDIYEDNPFYRTLFLFAIYGRRWNEIKTLEWRDIDFLNSQYTIRDVNNKIGEDQTYDLPPVIANSLQEIPSNNSGLILKSPVTGRELTTPKTQISKIKTISGIEELTMHYFRHILVSAMGEMGTAATVLSASLGHTNLQTVNDYYLSANHTKGSAEANIMIGNIVGNKED